MRQHVNPLSRFYQQPLILPGPDELFDNPALPIHLDIGSARGKFLIQHAPLNLEFNHLGVEIRKPLAEAAEAERKMLEINNLSFCFCNANVSLEAWLSLLDRDQLRLVSIQFPDPCFKRRQSKRRLLQPKLLTSLAASMQEGAELFIQSDIADTIKEIRSLIDISGYFSWLSNQSSSPFFIMTERERYVLENGLDIYRLRYIRNNQLISERNELLSYYQY